jgi:DNA-binding Lrp family transcriptional regulator
MLSAYVLIQTEVGTAAEVAQAIRDLDGPYDVIARVQARGLDQLGRLVVARIQAVDGVTRTLTCSVIRR